MLALYISLLDTEEQISKFEHIYTKYRGLMFYTAKGVLQDSYLAEDAVHETFLDIIRIIDSIRANNEKELSQFLRVLTHHKAVDMVRKCTRQKKSDTEIEDFDLSKSDVNVETIVLDKIDYENMLLRVQSMDEKYKTPLLLKVQGYKVSEIADFLNISPGNVKVRLHRARKIILTGLEEMVMNDDNPYFPRRSYRNDRNRGTGSRTCADAESRRDERRLPALRKIPAKNGSPCS